MFQYSGRGDVVVVVPVYSETLTADEQISVAALQRHLSAYDVALLVPDTLRRPPISAHAIAFNADYFSGTAAYSRLLLSSEFYRVFSGYRYMLIYQLDALVFSDQLAHWCSKGYDYIGAPVHVHSDDQSAAFVGNGGFSLRKIESFLHVLEGSESPPSSIEACRRIASAPSPDVEALPGLQRISKTLSIARQISQGVHTYAGSYTLNEDLFWSLRAPYFTSSFRRPSMDEAARFSIDKHPAYWMRRNDGAVPFGCHAWAKYDRDLWERHLS